VTQWFAFWFWLIQVRSQQTKNDPRNHTKLHEEWN
jgi:hypothetical protein